MSVYALSTVRGGGLHGMATATADRELPVLGVGDDRGWKPKGAPTVTYVQKDAVIAVYSGELIP